MARAIVIEPDVLLLDEPLSALDANLREEMRTELKTIQREVGITTIFVTHDQEEALAMSDRVVVMNKGIIEQQGSPEDVYRRPDSRFVATFLGQSNLLPGRIAAVANGIATLRLDSGQQIEAAAPPSAKAGMAVTGIVRAQKVMVGASGPIPGKIATVSYLGGTAAYFIDAGGVRLQAIAAIEDRIWREGEAVKVTIAPSDCLLLDETGHRLR